MAWVRALGQKILVVDDDWENRKLLVSYLRYGKYEVVEAENGAEALALAAGADLILLDVVMRDMDGFEVCRQLRQRPETRFKPIVLVTALREREHWLTGIDAGADEFLKKPVDSVELLVRVRTLLKLKDERDKADRLKDDLAAMLVHDLKSPLTSVKGFVHLLVGEDDQATRASYARHVDHSVDLLLGIADDLLEVSRMASQGVDLALGRVEVPGLLDELIAQATSRASGMSITVSGDCPAEIPPVRADRRRLVQILNNLVDNALKFARSSVSLRAREEGEVIVFRVEDDGPGFDPDTLPHLFDSWYQAREGRASGLGAGLGLAIVKRLAEAHGGQVRAASNEPTGAVFELVLPRA